MIDGFNYMLLDAARLQGNMERAKELNPNHTSLYKGRSEESLADVAPYLFDMSKESDFMDWYFQNGWGDAWGVFIQTPFSYEEIYKHFRKFLLVKTEDGQELYFRFYDPRVLRTFLPTCTLKQVKEFFGPVNKFICEDAEPARGMIFSLYQNNSLKIDRIPKQELFDFSKTVTGNEIKQEE